VTRTGRRYAGAVLAAGAVSALVASCAQAPVAPPQIPPTTATAVHQDARITLPVTVGIAFHHPGLSDRTEYEVLFTVQQALRAMVQAEYSTNGQDSALAEYWSGAGLTAVNAQIKQWTAHQLQPVGMIVIEDTRYAPADGDEPATVTFCADWSHVVRGESRTHVVGTAVQSKGARPAFEQFGLARAKDKRWRVDSMTTTPNSPDCP
jgi:hypothetical protein